MAPYEPEQGTTDAEELSAGRRKAARYLVPVAVAGVAAATIGLVPALASGGDPDLPKLTAQELIEKIAASDTEQLSGTVKINTDLGLPSFGGGGAFAPGGASGGGDEDGEGSAADPAAKLMELASGSHTLRVAADGPDKQKLSVLDDAAEYSVIHNGDDVWAYDSASNEAYHTKDGGKAGDRSGAKGDLPKDVPTTPKEFARQALKAADKTTSVKVDGSAKVAGRDAYRLVLKPKDAGTTVGRITIAVDAKTGTPLKFTLTPASGGAAVVDVGFTKVDFAKPSASTFDFKPAKGTKVTEEDGKAGKHGAGDFKGAEPEVNVIGKGWTSVAELELPGGQGLPASGSADVPADAQRFLDSLGDKVSGDFGSGTVFKTRLINALITDDGKVYVGAVTKDALVKAANR
ncbi:LolA family protein [Streptomyces spectabilis]|uniref:Outer membrane lipoprotein carrier protein LolA n=1 Tax=Streptomyces spectabilis TaxID=68270 RepID=A0A516RBQ3_STRST|nr:sigma-E factor regulatory protein RseB domain-containing protein [Streptomyces spectabilis]QDQ13087.1 outer membrane lipoprotein carrier protein LolA [Streptomyces spectabilis]